MQRYKIIHHLSFFIHNFCTFAREMRYFIWFSYDGTAYHGWQIQPNGVTVQSELQRCLSMLLRQTVEVVGAGRTDAGVHARCMVAHFDYAGSYDMSNLAYKLDHALPDDISIYKVEPVDSDMHARFSAKRRTYHYYIHTWKSPFLRRYSCQLHYQLDFASMNRAAQVLMEYEDFGAFCKAGSDVKTTLCQIYAAAWHQTSPTEWYFEISANRFLRNMVRAVVGTLIEVGRGRMTVDEFRHVIEQGRRTGAGESMPAHALFLENVEY